MLQLQVPYGYNLEGQKVVKDVLEQQVIEKLIAWWVEGISYNSMADRLDREITPTKRGRNLWQPAVISRILRRELC